jgi:hypothetical protein
MNRRNLFAHALKLPLLPFVWPTLATYDPDGLFFVHHGVGSEEWSPDGFARVI